MSGSLDDNPPRLFHDYDYVVLGQDIARIYVSKDGVMTRSQIAAQLRRLAEYVESLTDEQAHRP